MDFATIAGIISAFGLVIISISIGSGIGLFVNVPSLLIVVGGTVGATLVNYPFKDMAGSFKVVKNAFFNKPLNAKVLTEQFVEFATKARREGILALEAHVDSVDDAFLQKGLQLSVDGIEPAIIREIMMTEIDIMRDRHMLGAEIFSTMAAFSPALGMIGTLIGLVSMLQKMDDPSSIGPAMAIALLTTFYGSVLANLVFMPISGKLKTRSREEVQVKELIMQGVVSLTNGDNPRIIEQKLQSYLPPKLRQSVFR